MDTFELDNRVIETIIKSYTKESELDHLRKKSLRFQDGLQNQ